MNKIITVDGPSGSGKGTISQCLAKQLGWHYLDSGALYRILACAAIQHGIALDDEVKLTDLIDSLDISFDGGAKLDGVDVELDIRSESMGNCASKVAKHPQVRAALLALQRNFAKDPGLIADGRDMGTTVFPDSPLKIYLTASVEERASRRAKQMVSMGLETGLDVSQKTEVDTNTGKGSIQGLSESEPSGSIAALRRRLGLEIAERDERDVSRAESPLRPADDALVVDTSNMSIDDVVAQINRQVELTNF